MQGDSTKAPSTLPPLTPCRPPIAALYSIQQVPLLLGLLLRGMFRLHTPGSSHLVTVNIIDLDWHCLLPYLHGITLNAEAPFLHYPTLISPILRVEGEVVTPKA